MNSLFTRGAAGALLVSGIVGRAAAQGAVVVPVRPRDSVTVRIAPTPMLLDSIKLLFRALQTEPSGSAAWEMLKKQIDALGFPLMPSRIAFEQGLSSRESVMPKGSIGLNALGGRIIVSPAGQVVEYFDYPSIVSVDPDSPAQRAGIVPGDLLLAYDGLDVRGRQFNLTRMLLPDKKLGVTVRHDGESKEFALTVAKATERVLLRRHDLGDMPGGEMQLDIIRGDGAPRAARAGVGGRGVGGGGTIATTIMPGGGVFFTISNTAFGATLSTVGPELARTLKLELGVLVNEVPEESPAFKAGLRTGDVIVNADGGSITTVKGLQEAIQVAKRAAERGMTLQVVREKQPRKITVSW